MIPLYALLIAIMSLLGCCWVDGAITFVGTSNENLAPISLPTEMTVKDAEDVVRRTEQFRNKYAGSAQTYEEYIPGQNKTETKPDIFLVRGSPVAADSSVKSSPFGFIGAAVTAYSFHQNLSIRPDDIWITILSQFSFYVNARAELLRNKFVTFQGKKVLKVTVYGYTVFDAPYDDMTRDFLTLISENLVDDTLKDWFLPGFSTTTETDQVVAAATAMCTFQEYFTYTYEIACGIPHVTLEGTVEDWELLASKVDQLPEYDDGTGVLVEWVGLLRLLLGNFVESARNGSTNNLAFWDNICYYNSQGYGSSVLSGWITVFSYFDTDGQKMSLSGAGSYSMQISPVFSDEPPRTLFPSLDQSSINPNVLSCPAIIDDKVRGKKYNATLFVGQMSYSHEQSKDTATSVTRSRALLGDTIHPRNDWALVIEEGEVEVQRPSPFEAEATSGTEQWETISPPSEICLWYEQPVLDDDFRWVPYNDTTAFKTSTPTEPTNASATNAPISGGDGPTEVALIEETPTMDAQDSVSSAIAGCLAAALFSGLFCFHIRWFCL